MVFVLIRKELRDHLLSLRFQIGLALAMILVSASAFVLAANQVRDREEFDQRSIQEDRFLQRFSHPNRVRMVIRASRPPAPLVLLTGLPVDAGTEAVDASPMRELFPSMDFGAIVAVIFSLLGVVIGFDGVNGEKQQGTLRLVLANCVKRAEVIVAKWASGWLVLGVAILSAVLAGLLIVAVRAGVPWTLGDWLSIAAVAVAAWLYAGLFFTLALAVSALVTRSSVSVLVSLMVWVLAVLVVPNLSPYLAAQIVRVPAVAALERDIQFITSEERDELGRAAMVKLREKYRSQLDFANLGPKEIERRSAVDPVFRQTYGQFRAEADEIWAAVNRQQRERTTRLVEAWQSSARRQFQLSRTISYVSPLPAFMYAATELSVTGFESLTDYQRQAEAYGRTINDYLASRYQEALKARPSFAINDFLDVSTRPRFVYRAPGFPARMHAAFVPFVALGLWNVAGLMAAIGLFLRFDPR